MKLLIQRVTHAQVVVDGQTIGKIGKGLLVFLGIHHQDTLQTIPYFIDKVVNLRIFADPDDKMNLSVKDVEGSILLVSQFTLYGDASKGRRPSFVEAAKGEVAKKLYDHFLQKLREELGENRVASGEFGANMQVTLTNDGPVTLML